TAENYSGKQGYEQHGGQWASDDEEASCLPATALEYVTRGRIATFWTITRCLMDTSGGLCVCGRAHLDLSSGERHLKYGPRLVGGADWLFFAPVDRTHHALQVVVRHRFQ